MALCTLDSFEIPKLSAGGTTVYAFLNCTHGEDDLICLMLEEHFLDTAETTMLVFVVSLGIIASLSCSYSLHVTCILNVTALSLQGGDDTTPFNTNYRKKAQMSLVLW